MLKKEGLCECCERFEHQWKLESTFPLSQLHQSTQNPLYFVCSNCLIRLVNNSLSKKQYNTLLRNGHDSKEFLLHSDFYDENGRALQPR